MVRSGLSSLGPALARVARRMLGRDGFLSSIPFYMRGVELRLQKGSGTLEYTGHGEARLNLMLTKLRVPTTSRLSIPLDRISERLVSDLDHFITGDKAQLNAFGQALVQQRYLTYNEGRVRCCN
jgi:hypothetical protein